MIRLTKKIAIYFLAAVVLMTSVHLPVLAEENAIYTETEAEVVNPGVSGWIDGPAITAETAVVMEMTSAVCQYNKGRNVVRMPGELVKYMVMLLAAENCDLDDEVTFTAETLDFVEENKLAKIWTKVDEVLTVEECLYAIVMNSANDVAIQLAKHVGGSTEEFIKMMNKRAKELGCDETVFSSVTGLSEEKDYSSAYDIALIVRACLRNKELRTIVKKTSYTIEKTNKSRTRELANEDPLINKKDPGYYEGCRAVSLYQGENGKYNMVAAAKQNDITYIAVTLGNAEPEGSYVDSRALLDYAHNNFVKSDFMIGSVILPKNVSTDEINVKGTSDEVEVNQRYYINNWLVGKGSQDIQPPEAFSINLPDILPEKTEAVQEESDLSEEADDMEDDDFDDTDDEEVSEDQVIDMVETEEKPEYFTVFGLSLVQWNWIGIAVIAVGIVLFLICALIKQRWKINRQMEMQERERRKSRYDD